MRGGGVQQVNLANPNTSLVIDQRGRSVTGIYVPALGSATTVTLQGSHDGTVGAAKGMKDTSLAAVGAFSSGSGDFWIDGDVLARFYGVPYLVVTLGAAQTGTITFQVCQGAA